MRHPVVSLEIQIHVPGKGSLKATNLYLRQDFDTYLSIKQLSLHVVSTPPALIYLL